MKLCLLTRYLTAVQVMQRGEMFFKGKIAFSQGWNSKCHVGPRCAQACIFLNEQKNRLLSLNASHNSERHFIGYLESASIAEWRS